MEENKDVQIVIHGLEPRSNQEKEAIEVTLITFRQRPFSYSPSTGALHYSSIRPRLE